MPISDLPTLLRTLEPVLHAGTVAFCEAPHATLLPDGTIGSFVEDETLTLVLPADRAKQLGLAIAFEAAWITLTVDSDLAAVGLTAAVATALAQAGIPCNVIAAARHDHLFVPVSRGADAIAVLQRLQATARRAPGSPR